MTHLLTLLILAGLAYGQPWQNAFNRPAPNFPKDAPRVLAEQRASLDEDADRIKEADGLVKQSLQALWSEIMLDKASAILSTRQKLALRDKVFALSACAQGFREATTKFEYDAIAFTENLSAVIQDSKQKIDSQTPEGNHMFEILDQTVKWYKWRNESRIHDEERDSKPWFEAMEEAGVLAGVRPKLKY